MKYRERAELIMQSLQKNGCVMSWTNADLDLLENHITRAVKSEINRKAHVPTPSRRLQRGRDDLEVKAVFDMVFTLSNTHRSFIYAQELYKDYWVEKGFLTEKQLDTVRRAVDEHVTKTRKMVYGNPGEVPV